MPLTVKEEVAFGVLPFGHVAGRPGVSAHVFLGSTSMTSSAALGSLLGQHHCAGAGGARLCEPTRSSASGYS